MNTTHSFFDRQWRWFVLGTLFLATFLNYFDRQMLGTTMDPIARQFGLDNAQRGNLLSAFIYSYAFCHLFFGFVVDRFRNVRRFFPIMVAGWSASTMLVGLAKSYEHILWLRMLLGVWEAANFPICLMIISRIFPAEERSLASGVFASGAFLATLAAPPVAIYFSTRHHWQYSFLLAGALGFLWLAPWLLIFRQPERRASRWQTDSLAATAGGMPQGWHAGWGASLVHVLRQPGFWGVALMGLGIIPSLYFATQWFPSFFTQQLDHPYDQSLAFKLSAIYFMQDVGLWAGGAAVLWLSRRGLPVLASRKVVITCAYALMLSVLVVPRLSSINASVVFLCLYVCGIGAFLGNQHAFKQDVDRRQVATVAALVGAIETGFTAFVIQRVGLFTKETADFNPVFFVLAGLATFAWVIALVFGRPKWLRVQ
ncbi:MAG TPA: MFS transporter [Candidatus Paceibacterota bacterium]|nr:MFS transporter [Verrucomicrobiota bacterium]HOX01249.1 MFS transporter [Verrucomicrobiota bacterium]HRZ45925.1 MFS transporter [Candidatus Paceibacterota bacterium]